MCLLKKKKYAKKDQASSTKSTERERAILFNKKHSDPKLRILSEIVGTIFAFYMVSGCQQIKWFLLKF